MENPRSFNLAQAAQIYGVPGSTIRYAIHNGELKVSLAPSAPSQSRGRKPSFYLDSFEFEAWMHRRIQKRADRARRLSPEECEIPGAIDLPTASKISGLAKLRIWRAIRDGKLKAVKPPRVAGQGPGRRHYVLDPLEFEAWSSQLAQAQAQSRLGLSLVQAAALAGMAPQTLRKIIDKGELESKACLHQRPIRVPQQSLEVWMARRSS